MKKQKKYKIEEEMSKLNLTMYKRALKYIPELLDIAFNTFHNYRKMAIDAKADIPYGMVRKLEVFFGLKEGELANYTIDCKSLKEMVLAEIKGQNDQEEYKGDM
ncbi:hypothetical protein [Pedobacter psychroterrae]|uniref:Uncharacterized protein n=1 Tax=Pedobacter psychroterrae TaxID=2530453 RepID=A0A4R0NQ26_9SPHI|nr:hypothetical protein [Pedobacter psychroterrae]TCD03091.1 hypothetical protein EZ437_03690 [Pedobacter psychroterrae]